MPDISSPTDLATGRNVRAEMARKNVSQTTLAQLLGLSQAAVSARLRGATAWKLTELLDVASFLDVELAALIVDARSDGVVVSS